MQKRKLFQREIEYILDSIPENKCIFQKVSESVRENIKSRLRKQLTSVEIYPDVIPQLVDQITRQYHKTIAAAGEAVGIITAQSIGERQTQSTLNSVDWKELVVYKREGEIIIQPIGEMIDRLIHANPDRVQHIPENKTEYLELDIDMWIPSGDENGNVEWRRIEAVTRHLPVGQLVKVVTDTGRSVLASQSKSFLVWNGSVFVDTLGSDVKVGDIVPVTKRLRLSDMDRVPDEKINTEYARELGSNTGLDRVPELVFQKDLDFIKSFLDGFVSSRSSRSENGVVNIRCGDSRMCLDISHLLTYTGVFSLLSLDTNTVSIRVMQQLQNPYPRDRDVYFDRIVSVEYVDSSTPYVYDFTVETTRNFNLLNGLVVRDTFHQAGISMKTVLTGVPRFSELLNATRDPQATNLTIFFKKPFASLQDLKNTITNNLICLTLSYLKINCLYVKDPESQKPEWYEMFSELYPGKIRGYEGLLRYRLDKNLLFKYSISLKTIAQRIEDEFEDVYCVFSPDRYGILDVWIDTSNIKEEKTDPCLSTADNTKIYIFEYVYNKLENLQLSGIAGIKETYPEKRSGEWIVETDGSNLPKTLGHPLVDYTRTISNDMWEIYETLGIEAARNFLIEEFNNVVSSDGTYVNTSHIILLVDIMTFLGSITSISRYGLKKENCGPLAKASFEESLDNFIKAGVYGETENIQGVSASIMLGKIPKIGTGICDLVVDIKKLCGEIQEDRDISEIDDLEDILTVVENDLTI